MKIKIQFKIKYHFTNDQKRKVNNFKFEFEFDSIVFHQMLLIIDYLKFNHNIEN